MQHLVSSVYISLFLRADWISIEALCRNTNITPDMLSQQDYVAAEDVAQMFINLDQALNIDDWPITLARQFGLTSHGPLGFAALTAPTLADALRVFVDFHAVRVTGLQITLEEHADALLLQVTDTVNIPPVAQRMEQLLLTIFESLIEALLGFQLISHIQLLLAMPTPSYATALQQAYYGNLTFEQPCSGISLPKSWAAIPSPLHDENTYRLHCRQCRDIINRIVDQDDLVGRVERLLDNHFDLVLESHSELPATPSLESMASELHVSPRTLIRHLKAQQCHFRELLEERRRKAAEQLLMHPGISIANIAYRTGYREAANFSRAFRSWHGCSPMQWRKQL